MWTVTMTIHDEIDGIDISRDCVFKFDMQEDALHMVGKMTNFMKHCIGRYTIMISRDTQEAQPVDWKE